MIFYPENENNEWVVTVSRFTDPEFFTQTGPDGYEIPDHTIEWMTEHLLETPRFVARGRVIGLCFKNPFDQFYFKLRFYKGKSSQ
jgi:hypothetical protein